MQKHLPQIKKYIGCILIQVLVFYAAYPQALDVRGSSALRATGVIGLGLYAYFKFPYLKEIVTALSVYIAFAVWSFLVSYINGAEDDFISSFTNSQVAWFFTAFLIIFLIFRVHDKPTFNMLLMYIVGAVALQSVITLLMYSNQSINDFFYSLQLEGSLDYYKREHFEKERLIGYGIAFFGAGIVAGYGLVTLAYVIVKQNMNRAQLCFAALIYALIFFVGLFSARTTIIGLAMSLLLLIYFYLFNEKANKRQIINILGILIILMIIGVTLAFIYLPAFTGWAFELFSMFFQYGKIQTNSSAGLVLMMYAPSDVHALIFGTSKMGFFGSDVGYTRLLFYTGIVGTVLYFAYSINLIRLSWTKIRSINIFMVYLLIYCGVMNIKGLSDLNILFGLFFFFFLFYKIKFYNPKVAAYKRSLRQSELNNRRTTE